MTGSREGLPVPPGFILAVAFFEPWVLQLKTSVAWTNFLQAKEGELEGACDALKTEALRFAFTNEQQREVSTNLQPYGQEVLFAVRSSSPEEDLEGASFAGGYETVLGVPPQHVEEAVRKAFASCLDYRVAVYKRENGFDVKDPKIAVVVQKQIASDIAGVGFSLNPVTNNYDDAVFNANWGLGETVVAGTATPDTYVVDKVSMRIREKTIGGKETSMWLIGSGGTEEKKQYRSGERTLSDAQIIELAELIKKIELLYHMPIDIEWAYENGRLFLLQARPITGYVPLSPEMITVPGVKKRLYFDISITAEAMTRPISYMGTSSFRQLLSVVGRIIFLRDITRNIDTTIAHTSNGRLFVNLSTFFRLVGKKRISGILGNIDPLTMKAVDALDENVYMPDVSMLRLLPYGLLLRLPCILLFLAWAQRCPEAVHRHIEAKREKFERDTKEIIGQNRLFTVIVDAVISKMFVEVFLRHVPLVILSRLALGRMEKIARNHPEVGKLTRSLPHNVTIEMNIALSKLAEVAPDDLDAHEIGERLKQAELPKSFLDGWNQFMDVYGIRGPNEIDISAPRYSDKPGMLLDLIVAMKKSGESAETTFNRGIRERETAYKLIHALLLVKDSRTAKQFARDYSFLVNYGGLRETHKYYLVFSVALLRKKILAFAKELMATGRLDTVEQVFDLSLKQLDAARVDHSLDLRALAQLNTVFLRKLERVVNPPTLIDSRGYIPRPPKPPLQEGVSQGTAISPGIARGRVKVLHTPDEKPFLKGEILVARATDPGWTPLFLNAAGVVLEVGGVLQHGALVAREYGLPCVAGIENVTSIWKDGTLIEVDGSAGIVRIVKEF